MKARHFLQRLFILIVSIIILGSVTGSAATPQETSQSSPFVAIANQQPSGQSPGAQTIPVITRAEVVREGQKVIVRVGATGSLKPQTMRLNNPERLVLDFAGAKLSNRRWPVSGSELPVRDVRAGQFTPELARVVIDLNRATPYTVRVQENGVTVEFATAASDTHPAPATRPLAVQDQELRRGLSHDSTAASLSAVPDTSKITQMNSTKPAANPAATAIVPIIDPQLFANSFADGVLNFRAQDQNVRSIAIQVGNTAGIEISMGEDLGNEKLTIEFRHYRVDEALRQILRDYDAFFFYSRGADSGEPDSLQAVWVYPMGRGQEYLHAAPEKMTPAGKPIESIHTDPNSDSRARVIENVIRHNKTDSVAQVLEALGDHSEEVRLRVLYQALISGVEIPQGTLIDLALKDVSPNVRLLAFQALPLDPSLKWVVERAETDSSESISEMAAGMRRELDLAERAGSWAAQTQQTPQQ